MHPLITLAIYLAPFLALVIAVRVWMKRKPALSDVQAEGDSTRERARFLLWRRDTRD
jgi:hypothetical protein